jgi:hypothetical protein
MSPLSSSFEPSNTRKSRSQPLFDRVCRNDVCNKSSAKKGGTAKIQLPSSFYLDEGSFLFSQNYSEHLLVGAKRALTLFRKRLLNALIVAFRNSVEIRNYQCFGASFRHSHIFHCLLMIKDV